MDIHQPADQVPMRYGDWLQLTCRLLWSHRPQFAAPPTGGTAADNAGAWLVIEGRAQIRGAYGSHAAKSGQWLIFPRGQRRQYFSADTRLLSVAYSAHWPDGSDWFNHGLPVVLNASDHPALERRAAPMARLVARLKPTGWDLREQRMRQSDALRLAAMLHRWLEVLAEALAEHDIHPARLRRMDHRVVRALRTLDMAEVDGLPSIGHLAKSVGLSAVQLTRLFRAAMGLTPADYAQRRRMARATELLRLPDVRVGEVAAELGFHDPAHFTRWFRARQGGTPRAYRRGQVLKK